MLELQKYVGKDIGLYAGIISYIANNKEIGIDKDNINNVISITQNDKKIDDKNKKNEIILETFSSPEFNRQLLNNKDNCMSMAVGKEKQLAKEMALGCLGGTHTIDLILKRQTVVARVGAKQLPGR